MKKEKTSAKSSKVAPSSKPNAPHNRRFNASHPEVSQAAQELQNLQASVQEMMTALKAQQDALLTAVAVKAGVPMAAEPAPEVKPATRAELLMQFAEIVIEAWMSQNNLENSRQLSVFKKLNSPPVQKLLKQILDFHETV